jgi:translation elongation factor EF-G
MIDPSRIRNPSIIGHIDQRKTTLSERILLAHAHWQPRTKVVTPWGDTG